MKTAQHELKNDGTVRDDDLKTDGQYCRSLGDGASFINQSISMNLLWRPTSKALGRQNTVKIQQHNSVTIMIQRRGESLV